MYLNTNGHWKHFYKQNDKSYKLLYSAVIGVNPIQYLNMPEIMVVL